MRNSTRKYPQVYCFTLSLNGAGAFSDEDCERWLKPLNLGYLRLLCSNCMPILNKTFTELEFKYITVGLLNAWQCLYCWKSSQWCCTVWDYKQQMHYRLHWNPDCVWVNMNLALFSPWADHQIVIHRQFVCLSIWPSLREIMPDGQTDKLTGLNYNNQMVCTAHIWMRGCIGMWFTRQGNRRMLYWWRANPQNIFLFNLYLTR